MLRSVRPWIPLALALTAFGCENDAPGAVVTAPALTASEPGWYLANLTTYTSYPDPGSEECIQFSGCDYQGYFVAMEGQQPLSWVQATNIAAVHSRDYAQYELKTLRIRQGSNQIDATVYDMCSDSDCNGCCTDNSAQTGFLIDLESFTAARFGSASGVVEWQCTDC
jgi:hypothetical protein